VEGHGQKNFRRFAPDVRPKFHIRFDAISCTKCAPAQWPRTNLKVGGIGPAPENYFLSCPSTFLALKVQLSHFCERFPDGQYSLVSFLFAVLLHTLPQYPAICNSGGHVPPVPYGVGATAPVCLLVVTVL